MVLVLVLFLSKVVVLVEFSHVSNGRFLQSPASSEVEGDWLLFHQAQVMKVLGWSLHDCCVSGSSLSSLRSRRLHSSEVCSLTCLLDPNTCVPVPWLWVCFTCPVPSALMSLLVSKVVLLAFLGCSFRIFVVLFQTALWLLLLSVLSGLASITGLAPIKQ